MPQQPTRPKRSVRVGLGVGLALLVGLGRRVWILIPITGALAGYINAIPGSPSAWYLGVIFGGGMMGLRFLLRSNDFYWRWTWMDTLILLQSLVLLQAYLRNPTGFSILGDDMAGGKPYVEYTMAITGFYVLSFIKLDREILKKTLLIIIAIKIGDSILLGLSGFLPKFAYAVSRIYSNIDYGAAVSAIGEGSLEYGMDTRYGSLATFASALSLLCVAFYRPITCLIPIYPGRFLMFTLALVATFFSGFRSNLIKIGCYFAAACFAKRRPLDLAAAGLAGLLVLFAFVATDQVKQLPHSAQRVLSFLPIEVSAAAKADAAGSSEWRFEMWKIVMTGNKYIKNKFLGDGFGFSAAEQTAYLNTLQNQGYVSRDQNIDYFIAKGSYHGFHVETIRFTGYLGLLVATIILFHFAFTANKQVKYFAKTPIEGYVMFVCIPFLVEPFFSWIIFGSYKNEFVKYILAAAIIKMIDNVRHREIIEANAEKAELQSETVPDRGRSGGRPLAAMKNA